MTDERLEEISDDISMLIRFYRGQCINTDYINHVENGIFALFDELSTLRSTLDREREAHKKTEDDMTAYLIEWHGAEGKVAELESTLATVYEQRDFYRWFFELTNAQSREDLEEMYGEELPEGVNV